MKRYLIFLSLVVISCSSPNDKNFNGAWKYDSGSYINDDGSSTETNSDNIKSIKIYSDNYYSLITHIPSSDNYFAHSGSYSLEGDSYTELFKLHENPDRVGKSETFNFELINNQLMIRNEFMKEIWERIE